jgi:hypothetical protein
MTYLLPQGSLNVQRHVNRLSLPHVALLLFRARGSAGEGGMPTEGYTTEANAQKRPCRLTPAGAAEPERLIADQIRSIGKWIVSFDLGTDLPLSGRIKVIGVTDGKQWEILLAVKARMTPKEDAHAIMSEYYCEPVPEGQAAGIP